MIRRLLCIVLIAAPLCAQQPENGLAKTGPLKVGAPKDGYEISGTVVSASSGQPLTRARIAIASVDARNEVSAVVTGPDGRFSFPHLSPGKYSLLAQRPGFPPQSFDEHEGFSSAIAVGPSLASTGLVFRLYPEAVIAGSVRDEADEPVRDAEVLLFHRGVENGRYSTHLARSAVTDEAGGYHFGLLPEGEFLIAVKARPWYAMLPRAWDNDQPVPINNDLDVAYPLTFYPGVTEADSAAALSVHPGDTASADFILRATPSARLSIPAEGSLQPSANLTQRVFDEEIPVHTQNMHYNKMFVISAFAPGNYVVHVTVGAAQERVVEMSLTGETTLDLQDLPESTVTKVAGELHVAGLAGSLSDAVVQLEKLSPHRMQGARVSPDGKFEFTQVEPGTYEFRLFNLPGVFVQDLTGRGASGRYVKVSGGGELSLIVNASKGAGKITGTVIDAGAPFAGAMVILVPENVTGNVSLFRRDQSDSDGSFTLSDVVPGRYTLLALQDGWHLQWTNPAALKPFLLLGQSVIVDRAGKYEVKVALQKKQ